MAATVSLSDINTGILPNSKAILQVWGNGGAVSNAQGVVSPQVGAGTGQLGSFSVNLSSLIASGTDVVTLATTVNGAAPGSPAQLTITTNGSGGATVTISQQPTGATLSFGPAALTSITLPPAGAVAPEPVGVTFQGNLFSI